MSCLWLEFTDFTKSCCPSNNAHSFISVHRPGRIRQPAADVVLPVVALQGHVPGGLRQTPTRLLPAPAATALTRQLLGIAPGTGLETPAPLQAHDLPVRGRHLARVHVHADGMAVVARFRQRHRMTHHRLPASLLALEHRTYRLALRPGIAAPAADDEPAQAGNAQAIALDPDAGDHGQAVEVPASLEPGEPGATLAHPLEEALEGMIEALERPSLDGHRHRGHVRQGLAAKGQGLRLIEVGE